MRGITIGSAVVTVADTGYTDTYIYICICIYRIYRICRLIPEINRTYYKLGAILAIAINNIPRKCRTNHT